MSKKTPQKNGAIHKEFIAKITQAATAAGTTPQGACAIAKISEATWYNWRNGESSPTARDMQAVLDAVETYKRARAMTAKSEG